ncbi:MAG: endonuclease MutS2 [Clostridia bacterium]
MQERVLKTLEYDKIIKELKKRANCCVSREICDELTPIESYEEVNLALNLTSEAESCFIRSGASPVDDFQDVRELLKRIHAILFLPCRDLLSIAQCMKAARLTRSFLDKPTTGGMLLSMAHRLSTFEYVEEEINRCILNEDELFDGASPALARIRKQMRLANEKVREKLNSMIRSSTYQKYLQDPIITMRNGRFVIPVKQEYRQYIPGLIHDQSGSGATLFIEPTMAVDLGNEYKRLMSEESVEIERILSELTAFIAPCANDLYNDIEIMGSIDLAFAKAKLAREMNAIKPTLNKNGMIKIIKGRHPLISPSTVVPIDVWLGEDFKTLIITGPNTGGKTVTLKTVGLFTLMAQTGLFIPAGEGTSLSMYEKVYADIGDEQSIEQSLSTFSSHMTNIVGILNSADKNALVLLDELGAGTDPIEGAALAMSILENLHARRSTVLATTHYSEIKAFALTHSGMENASMEFDIDKLRPTYRLFIGIPGKSNAFEISRRLGLDDSTIEQAKKFIKKEDVSFEDIISGAESQKRIAEKERELAEQARRELYKLREDAERELKKLDDERDRLKNKAREDAKKIVLDAKREVEGIIRALRDVKNIDRSVLDRAIQSSRDNLRNLENELYDNKPIEKVDEGVVPTTLIPGQTVKIVSIDQKATVLTVPNKGEVQVQVGIIKMNAKLKDLRIVEEKARDSSGANKVSLDKTKTIGLELDIRGKLVDEAIPEVDRYIMDAFLNGLTEISIIHGKGTGALRAGIHDFLRSHSRVKSFRLGAYGEGDAGVTVITLKKD